MMAETMRIQRALARAGVSSRRAAEALIAEGRVTVNGSVARTGQSVDPARDRITVDGKVIAAPAAAMWLVLNKPPGVVTTANDPEGRKTVFSLVPARPGLTYVGRLDYMTEGVLLMTTDGVAAHRLTHPSTEIERTYRVLVRGNGPAAVRAAHKGVELEDGLVYPRDVEAHSVSRGLWELDLTITEGRTREIRRLCEALELSVERLVRTRFGPVTLGTLPPGESRNLTRTEREIIDAIAHRRS